MLLAEALRHVRPDLAAQVPEGLRVRLGGILVGRRNHVIKGDHHFVRVVHLEDVAALVAVIVIGLLNATFGLMMKLITLPLGILTFGIFFLVINAIVLKFASAVVPGFQVETFKAAFLGALALAVIHLLFGFLTPKRRTA